MPYLCYGQCQYILYGLFLSHHITKKIYIFLIIPKATKDNGHFK